MRIEAGKTAYFEGFKFKAEVDPLPVKPNPGNTAWHEAMHVVGAEENGTGVEGASIIPGPGYLGITYLSKPDAVSALAPHSMGASGTSYDVFIASQMGNVGGAESAARSIINSNMDKVEAVAILLEEKKSVGSGDIKAAISEVDNPLPRFGTIFVENGNGESIKQRIQIRDNVAVLPDFWLDALLQKPKTPYH